jgi:hypothetical protein
MNADSCLDPLPALADLGAVSYLVHRVQEVIAAQNLLASPAFSAAPGGLITGSSGPNGEPTGRGGHGGDMAGHAEESHQIPEPVGQSDDKLVLLQRVADARTIIEQAKGMLMAEHRMTADLAFDLLRVKSQNTNTKLRDVAAHHVLLHSGQFTIRGTTRSG